MYAQNPEMRKILGDNPFEVKNVMKNWVRSKDERFHMIPTDTLYIPIDKKAVLRSGMVIPHEYRDSMPEYMVISLKGRDRLFRSDLMLLEMLAEANWERPLYMSRTVGSENYLSSLSDFFVTEGLAHRITPFNWKKLGYGSQYETIIDSDKMYDNVMNRFKFGGIAENPDYYLDETTSRMVYTHRMLFASLAERLYIEDRNKEALEVLERAEQVMPGSIVPHKSDLGAVSMADTYIKLGKKDKAMEIINASTGDLLEYLNWCASLSGRKYSAVSSDFAFNLRLLNMTIDVLKDGGAEYKEEANRYESEFNKYYNVLRSRRS